MGTPFFAMPPKHRLSKVWTALLQRVTITYFEGKFKLRFENVCDVVCVCVCMCVHTHTYFCM